MEYVRLGRSGLKVSRICVGCMSFGGKDIGNFGWTLGYKESEAVINKAIDLGLNFFDTADVYSEGRSEEILGRAIEGRRDELVIATKVHGQVGPGPNDMGLSKGHIRAGVKKSLARLRTGYIDLYQTHRWDYDTPIQETLTALDGLVKDGTVNYIGASSMWSWQFATALDLSERLGLESFVSMQDQYNLAYREEEREMLPLCVARGIGVIPWSPLARGFLGGRYARGQKAKGRRYTKDKLLQQRFFRPADFDVLDRVLEVAKDKGVTAAQVALAWVLHKPSITAPIVGATSAQQLEDAVQALSVKLSAGEIKRLEEPYVLRTPEGFV